MPQSFETYPKKPRPPSFYQLYQPVENVLPGIPVLVSRGDRPLKMTFEDQLKALKKHRGQVFILDIYCPISYKDPIHLQ
jgi:hypothetical protein